MASPSSRADEASVELTHRGGGIVAVSITTVIWGLVPLVFKETDMPTLAFATYRLWMGVLVYAVVFAFTGRRVRWSVMRVCALGGVFFWLVVTLQVVAEWGPLQAGTALLPVTLLMLLFSPRAGAWGDRLGPRVPLTVGPLVAATGVALLAQVGPEATYLGDVLPGVALLGAGLTITVTPLTSTVLAAVAGRAGLASGVEPRIAPIATAYVLILVIVGPFATRWAQPVGMKVLEWRAGRRAATGAHPVTGPALEATDPQGAPS